MFTRGALLYIGQRLVLIVFTAVAVSSIVFLGVHRLPGDALLNERRPDPAAEAALLHYYHLDLPLPEQYVRYVTGLLHGDLGESYVNRGVQIMPLLLREARVSAEVGAAAIVFTVGIGILLGVIAAVRQNTWVDYLATTTSVIGYSMPNFGIVTGSVVIENIFGIPGLGKEFATSILNRDYNIVIGLFTFYAIIIALANLLVDLLYTVIDPRIRY